MNEPVEQEIPLSQIEVDPDNVRSEYNADMVAGLRGAIKTEGGFINPPTVYAIGDGRYRVKHGSTRVLAAQGAVKLLRVRIVEPPASESTKLLSQMGENLLQGSLGAADIGKALKRLRSADGRERSLSQLLGALKAAGIQRTKSWASMHLTFAELAPPVQSLLNKGQLSGELAYQLRNLPAAEQIEWAQRIIDERLSVSELRQRLGLDSGDDSADSSAPSEFLQGELSNRFAEAAGEFAERRGERHRNQPDAEHRPGRALSRWELLPVSLAAPDARKLRPLNAAEWTKKATDLERQLAQEALFLGGYSAKGAIELVQGAMEEAQSAGEALMTTLNGLRMLVEHPAELKPGSALAEFIRIRIDRVRQLLAANS